MASRAELEQYAANPRVRIMLDAIARSEGTHGAANSYAVYGGKVANQLSSFAQHPGSAGAYKFKWGDGKQETSTAAGRYQMTNPTWRGLSRQYGLSDFSPRNQDLAAVALMVERGAINDVLAGNYNGAAKRLGTIWASLPTSNYNQPKSSQAQWNKYLQQAGANPSELGGTVAQAQQDMFAGIAPIKDTTAPTLAVATAPKPTDWAAIAPELDKHQLEAIMPLEIKNPVAPDIKAEFYVAPTGAWAVDRK